MRNTTLAFGAASLASAHARARNRPPNTHVHQSRSRADERVLIKTQTATHSTHLLINRWVEPLEINADLSAGTQPFMPGLENALSRRKSMPNHPSPREIHVTRVGVVHCRVHLRPTHFLHMHQKNTRTTMSLSAAHASVSRSMP